MFDCLWVKGSFGKVHAGHLTALLYHSQVNSQRVYKTGEMAKAISEMYGEEVKPNSLYRFREKCRSANILKNVAWGQWEILDDVYDRLREDRVNVGEGTRYGIMKLRIEEARRQYRLQQKRPVCIMPSSTLSLTTSISAKTGSTRASVPRR